jgi:hypothetical protein
MRVISIWDNFKKWLLTFSVPTFFVKNKNKYFLPFFEFWWQHIYASLTQ